jgi:hypothetical protein
VSARKLRMVEYLFSTHSLKPLLKDQLGRTALDDGMVYLDLFLAAWIHHRCSPSTPHAIARALWKGEELKAIEALYQKAII